MLKRQVPGTDISVSPFGLDGSVFGWASGIQESARILSVFAASGGNLVTTAGHYAGGRSEVVIGTWLKTLADREEAVIATKIGKHPDAPGLSPRMVVSATEASLRRLDTEYVDFLTLDCEDPLTPIDETFEAIDMLRRAGKVRYLSASGFSCSRLREINDFAESAAYPTFHLVKADYNLMQRDQFEAEFTEAIGELGAGAIAGRPLASGYLSGAFRTKADEPTSPLFAEAVAHVGRRGNRVLHALEEVALRRQETVGRIALSWVLSRPRIVAAAIRVKSADQLAELITDHDIQLAQHEVNALDEASG